MENLDNNSNINSSEDERQKAIAQLNTIETRLIFVSILEISILVFIFAQDPQTAGILALLFGPIILSLIPIGLFFSWKLIAKRRSIRNKFGKLPHNANLNNNSIAVLYKS